MSQGPGTGRDPDLDAFVLLTTEFSKLHAHLQPLRDGCSAGLTALRTRLDRLSVAALAADRIGRYLAVNRAAATLTGYDVAELEALSVWDLTPAPDARTGERLWSAFLAMGEQRGSYVLRGKRGRVENVYYYARAHVLPDVHVSLLHRI